MTQNQRVLQYMRDHGSITQMEATNRLCITRLASRIHDITRMGIEVSKRTEYGENEYGKYHYTRYSLV